LIAALILGFVNTIVRPVLVLLTLPVTMLTLGLFILIINGLMFWVVAQLVGGFHVGRFLVGSWRCLALQHRVMGFVHLAAQCAWQITQFQVEDK